MLNLRKFGAAAFERRQRLKSEPGENPGSPAAVSFMQRFAENIVTVAYATRALWEGGANRKRARKPAELICLFDTCEDET